MIESIVSSISKIVTNPSSIFLAFSYNMDKTMTTIFNTILGFFYAIFKWVLYFIDIIFCYVEQLAGLNMRFDSLEAMMSGDSDMVFNLLWSSKDTTVPIVKALLVLAVVVIIILSIIAIVKTSFESLKKGGQNQTLTVLKTTMKAFVLMLITPMMAIVGIIASNAILQSLYNATNVSGAASLSSQIFYTSSTSANAYRIYGINNQRIPITYDFSKELAINDYFADKVPSAEYTEYVQSESNMIAETYLMFMMKQFIDFDSLNDITTSSGVEGTSNYHLYYDINSENKIRRPIDNYKRIQAYREEYLVMADVVDFCVKSTTPVYFKTIQQMLESIVNLNVEDNLKERLFSSTLSYFSLKFLDSDLNELPTNYITSRNYEDRKTDWAAIRYVSNYVTGEMEDPVERMPIQYTHVKNAKSEVDGAKFIIASERTVNDSKGVSHTYFYPLTLGDTGKYEVNFTSNFISRGQIISAKGVFEEGIYPTTIRYKDDGTVVFYRDNIQNSLSGQASSLASMSLKNDSGGGFFGAIVTFFQTLFDPASLVPDLNFDLDAVVASYDTSMKDVNSINGGKMHIGYMFADKLTSTLMKSTFVLEMENVYQLTKLNYLILVMGSVILVKVILTAMFNLINRAFELFLIIIVYPTACATIPLDNGGYNEWVRIYLSRLFATYGAILGINFVLLLFPVINSLKFFDEVSIAGNIAIRRIGALFFSFMTINQITALINFTISIFFEIVAFTMITGGSGNSVDKVIGNIVGAEESTNNPLEDFMTAAVNVLNVISVATGAGKFVMGAAKTAWKPMTAKGRKEIKEGIKKNLPGSALIGAAKDKHNLSKKKKAQKDAFDDLKEVASSNSTSKEEVEKKMKALADAQSKYTKALQNPTGDRKAEEDKNWEKKRLGVTSSRADDGDASGGDDDDQDIDTSEMSEKELKEHTKRRGKTRKYIKRLEKKAKKGDLSTDEQKALEKYKSLREKSQEELANRREKQQELDSEDIDKKYKTGEISLEEYKQKKQEREEFNKLQKGKTAKEARKKLKEDVERKKEKREQREKDMKLFRHTDNKKEQNQRLQELDINKSEIEQQLAGTGFTGDINASTEGQDLTDEQKDLINQYREIDAYQQELIGINEAEYKNMAINQARQQNEKNAKYQGTGGMKAQRITRRNEVSQDETKELDELNQRIEAMKQTGVDSSNIKQFRDLMAKKAELETHAQVSQHWEEHNNEEGRQEYKEENSRKTKALRQQAMESLEAQGKDYTSEEAINEYVKNAKNAREKKKKKKQDEQ